MSGSKKMTLLYVSSNSNVMYGFKLVLSSIMSYLNANWLKFGILRSSIQWKLALIKAKSISIFLSKRKIFNFYEKTFFRNFEF